MKVQSRLVRGQPAPFLPAPRALRTGDYIFTSSIYPIDDSGHAVGADEALGEAGPSAIDAQTRRCLEQLGETLEQMGSSLDRVLKVDVHLASAADFYEFKLVWRQFFPTDPPARTAIVVGEAFPFPGARLNLDAVALASDSSLVREAFRGDPDPLEAEWASAAVRAGNLVFCSGFPAIDFKTGLAVGQPPNFPYYGDEAHMQAEWIFEHLNRVLAQAGTSVEQAVESQLYEPDLHTFYEVDTVWGKYMPLPPPRSSIGIAGLTVPGARCVVNLTVLVPDAEHVKSDSRAGIRWHPKDSGRANFSPTIKAGQWRYFAGQVASGDFQSTQGAPAGLPNHFSEVEEQAHYTLNLLTEQLEANDTDWEHCYQVRVFLIHPERDYRGFIRVWRSRFPDPAQAPTLAYVPSTDMMFKGPVIEIDPSCIAR